MSRILRWWGWTLVGILVGRFEVTGMVQGRGWELRVGMAQGLSRRERPFVLPSNICLIKIETNLALAGLNSAHVKF